MLKILNRKTTGILPSRPLKVLQFGEGNFLRAFVDWTIDILNEKTNFNGSVQIVQPIPQGMGAQVNAQDGLYHVVLTGIKNGKLFQETRLITSVKGVINPFEDYQSYLKIAEESDLKFIVSNTTEAGITFSSSDNTPEKLPDTFPGKLTLLLYHRYQYFDGASDQGLIFMPCELIEKNGETLKKVILQYILHWNLPDGFKEWTMNHNVFCNTLVDRIVPGFPKDIIDEIQQSTGYQDNLVVMAEPFYLWVIETPANITKDAIGNLFPVEKAGLQVKFVKDLSPYRTRKVRILNGAHTAMVPVAYLRGLRTVRESIEDAYTGNFIRKALFEEIIPTLDLSKEELNEFANDVLERFQNPSIKHELISIALNSISKFKVRVLPTILEYEQRTHKLPERLLQALAALIVFYKGNWRGEVIPLNDSPDVLVFLKDVWQTNSVEVVVQKVLSHESFWDCDLTQINGLQELVTRQVKDLNSSQ